MGLKKYLFIFIAITLMFLISCSGGGGSSSNSDTPDDPNTPTGPDTAGLKEPVTFSIYSSRSLIGKDRGDKVYRFDFGDGSRSSWDKSSNATHQYSSAGNFSVKSQAKFKSTGIESDWSHRKNIEIDPNSILLKVKECAGAGTDSYPITTVVPIPYGYYQTTGTFYIEDESRTKIPAQFEVLNRWADDSIKHVKVNYQVTVDPFTTEGTGITNYYFKDGGSNIAPATAVVVADNTNYISVNTGPLIFTINKNNFNILDRVAINGYEIISPNNNNGGIFIPRAEAGAPQYGSSRNDVTFEVEESGPMRAVIRAESYCIFNSTTDHRHGFAVRIYAYAGKPYIKIDYQLQNSAKNVKYSWPLYFEELKLDFQLNLTGDPDVSFGKGDGTEYTRNRGNGLYLAQEFHNNFKIYESDGTLLENNPTADGEGPDGYINIDDGTHGVMAAIRYCWQTWPNGLAVGQNNKLSLQLFPNWSQCYTQNDTDGVVPSPSGLYWLEDMQNHYKETLLYFYTGSKKGKDLKGLANTFDYHPVAVLPISWYQKTAALFDLDGTLPYDTWIATSDVRKPEYHYSCFENDSSYNFGWDNFFVQVFRKAHTNTTGGYPYSAVIFIGSGNPSDYYYHEQQSIGELNVHPEWLSGYNYQTDFATLKLTSNPYISSTTKFQSWRSCDQSEPFIVEAYLENTAQDAEARDDQHAWFGEVEELYHFTANPWIKDWYKFIAQYRMTRLTQSDPFPDMVMRGIGNSLHHAFQAYRVTGNKDILSHFKDYLINVLRPDQINAGHGGSSQAQGKNPAFMAGHLFRPILLYMREIEKTDTEAYGEAFNYLSGLVDWNLHYCNFAYSWNGPPDKGVSSPTGASFVDSQAWYYWNTGKTECRDHLELYITEGINGGEKPYPANQLEDWGSQHSHDRFTQYVGRFMTFLRNHEKTDTTPPDTITNIKVVRKDDQVTVSWTAPSDVDRYHIVYSDTPFSDKYVYPITDKINWWAGRAINQKVEANPGGGQSFTFSPGFSGTCYIAIFSFDDANNMSEISTGASK